MIRETGDDAGGVRCGAQTLRDAGVRADAFGDETEAKEARHGVFCRTGCIDR